MALAINMLSSNGYKVEEIADIAKEYGIKVNWINYSKVELQADDPSDIARAGGILAHSALNVPLILEDTGFFIKALKGFPGSYAAQALHTIGPEGILTLMKGIEDRSAYFKTAVCYVDRGVVQLFEGTSDGSIAEAVHGGRAFGFDPIFMPDGYDKAFSELSVEEKNRISHRAMAFRKFAEYFGNGR